MGYRLTSLCAFILFVAVIVIQQQRRRSAARHQRGTGAPSPAGSILGIDLTITTHNDLSSLYHLHQKYGHTFEEDTLVNPATIFTNAPENIKTVNMRQDLWGIQPQRPPGMEFFCGRGFLTMDGEVWQHSRALLGPTFAKSNISDLGALSREMAKFFEQLLEEGKRSICNRFSTSWYANIKFGLLFYFSSLGHFSHRWF
jgi:cytochrome P450